MQENCLPVNDIKQMKLYSLLGMTASLFVLGEPQPKVALGDHK